MRKKQSVLGIISTIFSLFSCTLLLLVFTIVTIVEDSSPGYLETNQFADKSLLFGLLLSFLISIAAIILGIIGCLEREKTKVFSIIGISISLLYLFSSLILIVLALNIEQIYEQLGI
jgi:hypothetical protein